MLDNADLKDLPAKKWAADRKSMRYRSCRSDDADLRDRLRALAGERRRFGYRRLHILLRREGRQVNRKKVQRIYREEGLTVRRRRGRGCAGAGTRAGATQRALGHRLRPRSTRQWPAPRIFNVADDITRECLVAVADTSISGRRVVRELAILFADRTGADLRRADDVGKGEQELMHKAG